MKKKKHQRVDQECEKLSRTQKKKTALAMQKTGEALLSLTETQLRALTLPEELYLAVAEAHRMRSHGARRRQLQYIGTLMREADADQIQKQVDQLQTQSSKDIRRFKQVELWRDELINGDDERIQWLLSRFPQMDREILLGGVKAARQSQGEAAQKKAGRALFRFLRQYAQD